MRILSSASMRRLDQQTIQHIGIPGAVLMERAALGAADALAARDARGPFAVLIGPGNNGGDGSALARILHERAHEVVRIESSERSRLEGDAARNARIADALGIPCIRPPMTRRRRGPVSRGRADALRDRSPEPPRGGVDALLRQASAHSPEFIAALDANRRVRGYGQTAVRALP